MRLLHAAAAASLLLGASTALANPPAEAFGDLPMMSRPALSPDGRHFATVQSLDGRPAVVIYTVNAGPADRPAVIAPSDWVIDGFDWVKNDRLVVYIKVNAKAGYEHRLMYTWVRAVSVDVAGGNEILLLKDSADFNNNTVVAVIADKDMTDPDSIFMEKFDYSDMRSPGQVATDSKLGHEPNLFRLDLYKVDVHTGRSQRVASGTYDTTEWFTDSAGQVVARVNQTHNPLKEHVEAFRDGDWHEIASYDATGDRGAGIMGVSQDGKTLLRWNTGADSMRMVARLELATGAETPLYSDPKYDLSHPLIDGWTRRVLGVAYEADKTEYHYFDAKWDGLQKGLEAAFPGVAVTAVSWNTALDKLIVRVEAPRTPPAYYYLDRATHQATKIGSAYPPLNATDLGETTT